MTTGTVETTPPILAGVAGLHAAEVINTEAADMYHCLFTFIKEAIDLWTM